MLSRGRRQTCTAFVATFELVFDPAVVVYSIFGATWETRATSRNPPQSCRNVCGELIFGPLLLGMFRRCCAFNRQIVIRLWRELLTPGPWAAPLEFRDAKSSVIDIRIGRAFGGLELNSVGESFLLAPYSFACALPSTESSFPIPNQAGKRERAVVFAKPLCPSMNPFKGHPNTWDLPSIPQSIPKPHQLEGFASVCALTLCPQDAPSTLLAVYSFLPDSK